VLLLTSISTGSNLKNLWKNEMNLYTTSSSGQRRNSSSGVWISVGFLPHKSAGGEAHNNNEFV
jgi:hypothetical protein